MLLQGNAPSHKEVTCDLFYVVLEKIIIYKTPPEIYFGNSWSSGSTTLNSSIFESK